MYIIYINVIYLSMYVINILHSVRDQTSLFQGEWGLEQPTLKSYFVGCDTKIQKI